MSIENNSFETSIDELLQPVRDVLIEANHPLGLEGLKQRIALEAQNRALQESESNLRSEARNDPLTGALNRRGFNEKCIEALAAQEVPTDKERRRSASRRAKGNTALLFIDLDGFKQVNDTLGHAKGDDILVASVDILKGAIRPTDHVGRLGGDELAVLMTDISSDRDAYEVARLKAEDVRSLIELAFQPPERVTASIGVYVAEKGDSLDTLNANADEAMYAAKETKNEVVMYKDLAKQVI